MMRTIEVRRHAKRNAPLEHLSQEGVSLARQIGSQLGPYERVITSTALRAYETAIAMGFAVDNQVEYLSSYGNEIEIVLPLPQPFSAYQARRQHPDVAAYLSRLEDFYQRLVGSIPEDSAALVILHGGIVEMSAIACFPDADYGEETAIGHCEGVKMFWDSGQYTGLEILRIPS